MSGPEDRLKEAIPSAFGVDEENWNALLKAKAGEFDEILQVLQQVNDNKFLATATDGSLERLASLFQLERQQNETEEEFRARIKTGLRRQIGSATIEEIRDVVAIILDIDEDEVTINEPTQLESAFIELEVEQDTFDTSRLIDIVRTVTAAGVDVGIRVVVNMEDGIALDDTISTETGLITDVFGVSDAVDIEAPLELESVAITDTATVPSIVEESDSMAMGDESFVSVDTPQQNHWNDGTWNIDYYDTATIEFTISYGDSLGITDTVTTTFPVKTDSVMISDSTSLEFDAVTGGAWNLSHWDEGAETSVWPSPNVTPETAAMVFNTQPLALLDTVTSPEVPKTSTAAINDTVQLTFEDVTEAFWNESVYNSSTDVWA